MKNIHFQVAVYLWFNEKERVDVERPIIEKDLTTFLSGLLDSVEKKLAEISKNVSPY